MPAFKEHVANLEREADARREAKEAEAYHARLRAEEQVASHGPSASWRGMTVYRDGARAGKWGDAITGPHPEPGPRDHALQPRQLWQATLQARYGWHVASVEAAKARIAQIDGKDGFHGKPQDEAEERADLEHLVEELTPAMNRAEAEMKSAFHGDAWKFWAA